MSMNPLKLGQLKPKFKEFQSRHPRFVQFFTTAVPANVKKGSVLEVKVTNPEGKELKTNIKVTAEDAQLLSELFSNLKSE